MNYFISKEAEDDIDAIWLHGLDRWGLKQADAYQNKIYEMINFLVENITFGKKRDDIEPGYISYSVGSHLIFFKRDIDEIKIIRVLYKGMDYEKHLTN